MATDHDTQPREERTMPPNDELTWAGTTVAATGLDPMPEDPAPGPAALLTETVAQPHEPIEGHAPLDLVASLFDSTVKHYEILRTLGEGGMGTVFLARDTKLGRLVAIKVLLKHTGISAARFLAEARATARCKHENIVVIHEVDELHGYPFMVLEYLEGRTLRAFLMEREASELLSPSVVVELVMPVVRALSCAHKLGIVHRDLKPENILLTDAGPIKVLDFGIAKRLDAQELAVITGSGEPLAGGDGLTQEGALLGTLPYMSPEQLRGEEIDPRSDLWAVGILLYELCTGARPMELLSMVRRAQLGAFDAPMPSVSDKRSDVGALGAIIDRCLMKRKAERFGSADELLAALSLLLPNRQAKDVGEDDSPFAGLAAFQEADAARFFGREREVKTLIARLRHQPLVVVAGPSGAGKSSFVCAGVIPALKRSGERWEAFILRPGRRPLAALAEVFAQVAEAAVDSAGTSAPGASAKGASDPEELAAAFRAQPGLMGVRLRARCRRQGGRHRILLFVDQFEELYTLGADPAERATFVACLSGAADDASSPLRVLLSIRSDFLDRTAEDQKLTTEVTRGLSFLPPMGRDGLRAALTRPIEAAGHRFESDDMALGMLDALERSRSPLPLLQFTATKVWEARDRERRLLTRHSYDKLGGVAGALSTHADAVLAGLSPFDQQLCRAVFLRLVTPERTRAVVSMAELGALAWNEGAVEQVVLHLADARLLLIEPGSERNGATVELCHESLIDSWAKLKQWLDQSEQDAQFLARLRAAAQQWETSGQIEGLLWRDRLAEDARAWLARQSKEQGAGSNVTLGKREERYLAAVVALLERARRRRRQLTVSVIATLTAVAFSVSLLAIVARGEARLARNATRMATVRELQQSDPTTALALLREVEPPGVPRGWAGLALVTLQSRFSSVVLPHLNAVRSAAFSPDGKRIVTASQDSATRMGNARQSVTASSDKTARVWNADGTGEPLVLRGHDSPVNSAAFSPDGRRIVTASEDQTARVYGADGTGEPLVLRGHDSPVNSAAFSPDGRHIVTASQDRTARVYSVDGTGEPFVLRGHESEVYSAAWSLDGKRIVTASQDRTARVWNADRTGEPLVLRGHESEVYSAAFGPDDRRIVTASEDRTARVYSADGAGAPLVLRGHERRIHSAAFSPDGKRVVTASEDRTARVWNADGTGEPLVLRGHEGAVMSAAFSPDGKRIVTASEDKTARVWSADGTGEPLILQGHESVVMSAAWSPDGQVIATASLDRTVRVWNADGTGAPRVLRRHENGVLSVAFSPDGRRIISASQDKTARVWYATVNGEYMVLRGHEDMVSSASFSPDSKHIVTASLDRTARIWSADGTGEPLVLRGHEGVVSSAAWSSDGQRIVTASEDKTARVYLAPLRSVDDPKLWTATAYCMSTERRLELLSVSRDTAQADQQACQRRVAEARAGAAGPDGADRGR
jgi:WD40 repeat protein